MKTVFRVLCDEGVTAPVDTFLLLSACAVQASGGALVRPVVYAVEDVAPGVLAAAASYRDACDR